jgi:RNA polymerase sigma-70 factor (ECF subfamily)
MSNERDRERARKRGGDVVHIDVADADTRYEMEGSCAESPEALFERQWALQVLERTFERLGREHEGEKRELFEALKGELQGASESTYAEIAVGLKMTEGAVKTAASRMRKRWRELLRAEVAGTLSDPGDVDDELRGLFAALSK